LSSLVFPLHCLYTTGYYAYETCTMCSSGLQQRVLEHDFLKVATPSSDDHCSQGPPEYPSPRRPYLCWGSPRVHDALAKRVLCVSCALVLGPWLRSALYVQAVSGPGSAAASFSHCHDVDLTKMAIETRGHRHSSCNSPASALDITLLARL
jgi:hypothetical protein